MAQQCSTCKYFKPIEGQRAGQCVRNPPVPLIVMQQVQPTPSNPQGIVQQLQGAFPPVAMDTVCGMYVVKLEAAH